MIELQLACGDDLLPAELPDTATVVRYGDTYTDPPAVDAFEATRQALAAPLGMPPLRELVGPDSTVAIAFPDRVKGGTHPQAHRKVAIPLILDELAAAGVADRNITFVCAIGLHRKNSREEMAEYLPEVVLDRFGPEQLINHDAEDPRLVQLGRTEHGDHVDFNPVCAEADLCIVLGHSQGNPYGGFSGGYKTPTTGLTSWKSIGAHHTPSSMHRADFVPINPHSHFRSQLNAIGKTIEEGIGKPFFLVDAVTGSEAQVLGVFAGAAEEVQRASWPLATRRTQVELDVEPADVLVLGLPRSFHYGPGMGTNPILMLQAMSSCIARAAGAFREGGVAIAAAACDGWFNDEWFPSYRETFELYQDTYSVTDMAAHEKELAGRQDYIDAYRDGRSYHPFHAFSMLYMGEIGVRRCSRIFVPGAQSPQHARAMGLTPTRSFADAFDQARRLTGPNPRVLALPDFLKTTPPHLFASRG
jgi:nickel-dependent lactate racemase